VNKVTEEKIQSTFFTPNKSALPTFLIPVTFLSPLPPAYTTYPNWGCHSLTGSRWLGAVETLVG